MCYKYPILYPSQYFISIAFVIKYNYRPLMREIGNLRKLYEEKYLQKVTNSSYSKEIKQLQQKSHDKNESKNNVISLHSSKIEPKLHLISAIKNLNYSHSESKDTTMASKLSAAQRKPQSRRKNWSQVKLIPGLTHRKSDMNWFDQMKISLQRSRQLEGLKSHKNLGNKEKQAEVERFHQEIRKLAKTQQSSRRERFSGRETKKGRSLIKCLKKVSTDRNFEESMRLDPWQVEDQY